MASVGDWVVVQAAMCGSISSCRARRAAASCNPGSEASSGLPITAQRACHCCRSYTVMTIQRSLPGARVAVLQCRGVPVAQRFMGVAIHHVVHVIFAQERKHVLSLAQFDELTLAGALAVAEGRPAPRMRPARRRRRRTLAPWCCMKGRYRCSRGVGCGRPRLRYGPRGAVVTGRGRYCRRRASGA